MHIQLIKYGETNRKSYKSKMHSQGIISQRNVSFCGGSDSIRILNSTLKKVGSEINIIHPEKMKYKNFGEISDALTSISKKSDSRGNSFRTKNEHDIFWAKLKKNTKIQDAEKLLDLYSLIGRVDKPRYSIEQIDEIWMVINDNSKHKKELFELISTAKKLPNISEDISLPTFDPDLQGITNYFSCEEKDLGHISSALKKYPDFTERIIEYAKNADGENLPIRYGKTIEKIFELAASNLRFADDIIIMSSLKSDSKYQAKHAAHFRIRDINKMLNIANKYSDLDGKTLFSALSQKDRIGRGYFVYPYDIDTIESLDAIKSSYPLSGSKAFEMGLSRNADGGFLYSHNDIEEQCKQLHLAKEQKKITK